MSSLAVAALFCGIFCVICSSLSESPVLTQKESLVYEQLQQRNCGSSVSSLNHNFNGSGRRALLMSQPWIALIYAKHDINSCRCGGALISESFVLTSAHCLAFCPSSREFIVRLGEHNIESQEDCISNDQQTICAPPVEDFIVSKSIFHDNFLYSRLRNDIALLRLSRKVVFKDHIRPICLPLTNNLQSLTSEIGQSYISFRWKRAGELFQTLIEEKVKTEPCPVDTHESFLCTIEDTACQENSGGPLTHLSNYFGLSRHVIFGLASHGKDPCGPSQRAYYTDVSLFMPWVLKTLAKFATL
ncbi:serine protease grass-like [Drosophila ficusphila]|uniref:serine protease grass-like n=1 Tax=Drosophila ficusphila TaxID=30025 RepID=UPI0007E5C587|nr:serine protease grass-like [Drosophila ficusphila]